MATPLARSSVLDRESRSTRKSRSSPSRAMTPTCSHPCLMAPRLTGTLSYHSALKATTASLTDLVLPPAVDPRPFPTTLLPPSSPSPMHVSRLAQSSAVSRMALVAASSRPSSSPPVSPTSIPRATIATSMASLTSSGSVSPSWAAPLCCVT